MSKSPHRPSGLVRTTVMIMMVVVLTLTLGAATYSRSKLTDRSARHFEEDTKLFTATLVDRADAYNSILLGARSFMKNSNAVDQAAWEGYIRDQKLLERYPGISTVTYMEVIDAADKEAAVARIQAEPFFGPDFDIQPAGDRPQYVVATLVATNNDVSSGLGFDNYSTEDRKNTYKTAERQNIPIASPPLRLISGYDGFVIALPVLEAPGKASGFVTISFRVNDFIASLYGDSLATNLASQIVDVTDQANPKVLYKTANWDSTGSELTRSDTLTIGGRQWQLQFKTRIAYDDTILTRYLPGLVLLGGTIVMIVLSLIYHLHAKSRELQHVQAKSGPPSRN